MNPAPKPVMGQLPSRIGVWLEKQICSSPEDGHFIGPTLCICDKPEVAAELVRRWNCHGELVKALEQLAQCDLNESNCASLGVASKRVMNIANAALKHATEQKPINQER